MDSLKTFAPARGTATPQTEKAAKGQKKNLAGGFTFTISDLAVVKRFLILGSEKSYYQSGESATKFNAENLIKVAVSDSKALVDLIVEISTAGRAPKQQPGLFALAVASSYGSIEDKQYALSKLPEVARTGTSLFQFVEYVLQFRSWGRALKNAVGNWYAAKDLDPLAYQMVKYQNREGWSHGDLLRLTHPKGDEAFNGLARWALKGDQSNVPRIVEGFEKAKTADDGNLIDYINEFNLSWEMVPSEKRSAKVWEVLLKNGMPLGALIRQLPTLTRNGVISPLSEGEKIVVARLGDEKALHKARIHPISILIAMKTYESGRNEFGKSWSPSRKVIDALDKAFYLAFENVEPTGLRYLNALDVSGSMGSSFDGRSSLSARDVSAAMSLVLANTEPSTHTIGFTGPASNSGRYYYGSRPVVNAPGQYGASVMELSISPRQRLTDAVKEVSGLPFGRTDCALPMLYALENNLKVDVFVVYTDNETYAGNIHPFEALKRYRKATGIDAKLIVLATSATKFSIADASDPGMLDIAGFDSAVPQLISEFVRGL